MYGIDITHKVVIETVLELYYYYYYFNAISILAVQREIQLFTRRRSFCRSAVRNRRWQKFL